MLLVTYFVMTSKISVKLAISLKCSIFFAKFLEIIRGGSRAAATSRMEHFVIIVKGFQQLTIITKRSIVDVAAVLDPSLILLDNNITCLLTPVR